MDEPTQLTAPDHQHPVGEVSLYENNDALAVLIDSSGITGSWVLNQNKEDLTWTFGRGAKVDFSFPSTKKRLSSMHFKIWATRDNPPAIMLQDVSTNGTFLNNVRIPKGRNCMLVNGDVITVGLGVVADEIKLVVSIPRTSRAAPQGGIYDIYDLGDLVGQGAFALVRQAIHRETGQRVAVKIIDKTKITGSLEMAVEREIEILKRLRHDNIVALHDIFIDEKNYYLVMDFVPHGDLMDYLLNAQTPEKPGLPEEMSREIVRQLLEAVKYVHSMGISHRDLKPDNILINSFDPVAVKVGDFGLAKLQGQGTFLKTFCGTLSYLAPEVLLSRQSITSDATCQKPLSAPTQNYTNSVDIWSVGCLSYVILTGCMPFGGTTQEGLYRTVIAGEYFSAPLDTPNISAEAKQFIATLLDTNTETRPNAEQCLTLPWLAGSPKSSSSELRDKETSARKLPSSIPAFGFSSDSDNEETRREVNFMASQKRSLNREQSQSVDPRDYIDESIEELEAWGELETMPTSLPCKDLFLTKPVFTIGRCNNKLDGKTAYVGPALDFTHSDARLSRIHCRLGIQTNANTKKLEVWLEAFNMMYVNTQQLDAVTRTRVYNGDKISLFAAQVDNHFESLMFSLKLFGEKSDYTHFDRPTREKKHPILEPITADFENSISEGSMALPVPETPLKMKRERSEELAPAPKRTNTLKPPGRLV